MNNNFVNRQLFRELINNLVNRWWSGAHRCQATVCDCAVYWIGNDKCFSTGGSRVLWLRKARANSFTIFEDSSARSAT